VTKAEAEPLEAAPGDGQLLHGDAELRVQSPGATV